MNKVERLLKHIEEEHPEAGNVRKGLHCEPNPLLYLQRVDAVFHGQADASYLAHHLGPK